jgi:hypothetical protein
MEEEEEEFFGLIRPIRFQMFRQQATLKQTQSV